MKKILAALTACTIFAVLLAAVGCSGSEMFEAKRYSSGEDSVKSVSVDVTDREVEIITSADGQVHIDYSESEQEFYSIRLSEDGDLTMLLETDKGWTDFIGTKPAAQYRKITLAVPDGLDALTIRTTNEAIGVSTLTVQGAVLLDCNGGSVDFVQLGVGRSLNVTAKNGNITGSILGGWDDFSIACEIKKGESNLPERKEGGEKSLTVNCNNGDIDIQFISE